MPDSENDDQELRLQLQRLEADLEQLTAVVSDRLDTVEHAMSKTDQDLQQVKPKVRYNYMMLGSVLFLLVAVAINFLPEKFQERLSGEKVSKNLQGFTAIASDLFQVVTVLGAGGLAYKANQQRQGH